MFLGDNGDKCYPIVTRPDEDVTGTEINFTINFSELSDNEMFSTLL
jgi:hypothetical protein